MRPAGLKDREARDRPTPHGGVGTKYSKTYGRTAGTRDLNLVDSAGDLKGSGQKVSGIVAPPSDRPPPSPDDGLWECLSEARRRGPLTLFPSGRAQPLPSVSWGPGSESPAFSAPPMIFPPCPLFPKAALSFSGGAPCSNHSLVGEVGVSSGQRAGASEQAHCKLCSAIILTSSTEPHGMSALQMGKQRRGEVDGLPR